METRIKSNLKKKSEKDYPFEIFWEAGDKAYFTEMQKMPHRGLSHALYIIMERQ